MCFSYRKYIAKINQQAQGSRRAGNHFQQAHQPQGTRTTRTSKARGSRYAGNHFQQAHEPHEPHEPARHEVQGMQVTTPTSKIINLLPSFVS